MNKPPLILTLHDHVRLRKPHPCGSTDWRIVRLGADIGLVCDKCSRRILLPRAEAERRIKKILEHGPVNGSSHDTEETEA